MATILVFGDSTAWGAWDLDKGGWVNRLWLFFARHRDEYEDADVYNLSISGGITMDLLKRFKTEAEAREPGVIIFQCGGNDSAVDAEGNYQVPPEQFKENLRELIRQAKDLAGKIVFVGFENVDESKTAPVPWYPISYKNENILRYNGIMKEVCEGDGVEFIDIFGLFENDDLEDGVHPNAKGHEKIFEKVKIFLLEKKMV